MKLTKVRIPPEVRDKPRFNGLVKMYKAVVDNRAYMVFYSIIQQYIHIRIIREDSKPVCNYMDMQAIKDLLIGANKVGIQVFPRQKDFINYGNTYHLWAWDDMNMPNLKELYDYSEGNGI